MQKSLEIPEFREQPPEQYRSRQFYLNNLGIYHCNTQTMNCFLWDEYTAHKESDDICSTLYLFLQDKMDFNKTLILWSDNCVSQNTSWKIFRFGFWLVETRKFKEVVLKQLLKGHTFNICDVYFGGIENKCKNMDMFLPEHYKAKMTENNCKTYLMTQAQFFNWDFLDELYQKKR